jgi:hypothetical protein
MRKSYALTIVDASTKFEQRILKVPRASSLAKETNSLGESIGWQAGGMRYSKNPECETAVGNAACIYKRRLGILKQSLNHDFRFAAIHNFRVDDIVI